MSPDADRLDLADQLLAVADRFAQEVVDRRALPRTKAGESRASAGKGRKPRASSGRLIPAWKLPFQLAQRLQGVRGAEVAFEEDPRVIFPAVQTLCRRLHAQPHDQYDQDYSEVGAESFFVQVVDAWSNVRVPGGGALVAAFRAAEREPVQVLGERLAAMGLNFRLVMSIAYHLQRYRGEEDILLPQEALGRLVDLDHTRVSSIIRLLVRHGVLQRRAKHCFVKGRAASYRFNFASPVYRPPTTALGGGVTESSGRADERTCSACKEPGHLDSTGRHVRGEGCGRDEDGPA